LLIVIARQITSVTRFAEYFLNVLKIKILALNFLVTKENTSANREITDAIKNVKHLNVSSSVT